MAHTGPDGSRTIDVLCTRCTNVVGIRQEPDAHGREKALLCAELARLHGDLDRIGEEFEEFKVRVDMARTADACRFAEFAAQILEKGIEGMSTIEEMLGELGDIRQQAAAAAVPGGGCGGCRCGGCGGGDPEQAALICEMEAGVSKLEKTLRYYDTANSRRGMPSLYDKEVKKFDQDTAEPCGRPVPEARRGPPMGHPGASHRQRSEKTIDCTAPCSCPDCGALIPADCVRARPESKTFVMVGADDRMHTYQLRVGHAWCQGCRLWARSADAPDVRGTCYSPALLAKLLILYSLAATDRKVSQRLPALFGFTGCPSALPSARKAIARVLEPFTSTWRRCSRRRGGGTLTRPQCACSASRATCGCSRSRAPPWSSRAPPAARRYSTRGLRSPATWPAWSTARGLRDRPRRDPEVLEAHHQQLQEGRRPQRRPKGKVRVL